MHRVVMGVVLGLSLAAFSTGCDSGGDSGSNAGGTGNSGGADGGAGGSGGAGGADGGAGGTGPLAVSITFEARVGAEPFACAGTFSGLGTTAAEAKITDYRLYVHDVELLANGAGVPLTLDQDGIWQHQNVALLDFEDGTGSCANGTAELRTTITGTVPGGGIDGNPYSGIRFKVGVPFELNHADAATAPSPLNLTALFWSWNGGYKFLRVDALPTGAGTAFNLHLGSTECTEDGGGAVTSCGKPNRPTVELTGKDPLATKILIDYAGAVQGSDLTQNTGAPGCMSGALDPECGPIFQNIGLDVQSGAPAPGQHLFLFDPSGPQ